MVCTSVKVMLGLVLFYGFILSMISIAIDASKGVFTLEWLVQCFIRVFRPGTYRPISDAHLKISPIMPF